MKSCICTVTSNRPLARDVYEMKLSGDTSAITAPGQFVNIRLDGLFLRRPLSVCDWETGSLTLIYKVVGQGTARLSAMAPGAELDLLTGLGNGYDMSLSGQAPLLLGGGVGVPPLYGLCRRLVAEGKQPVAILGFNSREDVFYAREFTALGVPVTVTTADGSEGIPGFVTDALPGIPSYTHFYTCGPEPMLKAVYRATVTDGQFSFEERMGCGFGACMGCSCHTVTGNKRICKEGPVLRKGEILWQI
jgi:dihydroorotate dehydrogenase electron transfer subunit